MCLHAWIASRMFPQEPALASSKPFLIICTVLHRTRRPQTRCKRESPAVFACSIAAHQSVKERAVDDGLQVAIARAAIDRRTRVFITQSEVL